MPRLQVLTIDEVNDVDAEIVDGRVVTDQAGISAALGWQLKPEGLCRDDVCVPVRDRDALRVGDGFDLTAVAGLLGLSTLVDADRELVAVSAPAADRRAALKGRVAPDFSLPDLDGNLHTLEEFKDRKRLLVAFASW
ncbi:MAG: hypothetical protein RIB98_00960 [Acidimicrobiales bacterium]